MKPAGRLPPQPWMTIPATRAVVAALTRRGQTVRFVGGCVRDAVLDRSVGDIDIATPDQPDGVIELAGAAGLKAVPTGIAHGTVTVVAEGRPFEVTTLRRDVETFGRHARVAFTDDWQADAERRDFTMNALFLNPYGEPRGMEDGAIFDPTGGLEDARAGRVRFVGDAETRIAEDYLRILRFFRFHAHYGRGAADGAALKACTKLAAHLAALSAERVRNELFKLLAAPVPATVVALMRGAGVLQVVLPEAAAPAALENLVPLEREFDRADAVRRLAALVPPSAETAKQVAERLKLSNADTGRLTALAGQGADGLRPTTASADAAVLRRMLRRSGAGRVRDQVLIDWARSRGNRSDAAVEAGYRALLASIALWTPVVFPLKGADVMALGVPNGKWIGDLLRSVEEWWEERDYAPDRAQCLAELRRRVAETDV